MLTFMVIKLHATSAGTVQVDRVGDVTVSRSIIAIEDVAIRCGCPEGSRVVDAAMWGYELRDNAGFTWLLIEK